MLYFDQQIRLVQRSFSPTSPNYRKGLTVIENIEQTVITSVDRLDRIGVRL